MQPSPSHVRGFTTIEVIVALATFAIIMLGVVFIFSTAFFSFRETRMLQRNLESAQFAMNTMAKELRTSSVVYPTSTTTGDLYLRFLDYSQGTCIVYWVADGKLYKSAERASLSSSNPNINRTTCRDLANLPGNGSVYTAYASRVLVEGVSAHSMHVVPSQDPASGRKAGRVTVQLRIGTTTNNQTIQSSVSLRDFNYIDI